MEKRFWQADPRKLREARLQAGYRDIKDFAPLIGISVKMVYMIEGGYSNPKVWQLKNWADSTSCRIDDLLSYEPAKFFSKRNSNKVEIYA